MSQKACAGWVLLSLLLCLSITALLQSRPVPAQLMMVQLVNESRQLLTRVDIKHGNSNTEELISALQIAPGEKRTLGLNHRPGMGFSLTVHYASGEHFEVCVGKFVEGDRLTEVIRDGYLDEYAGLYW
ncbi:hypothetical protein [Marinobacterium jannaschii]|uniref:hypothetical protein n=1 Tax=Marinobacterium jannaschii TaxID=64970 RepID=UPI000686227E|nr:hypothetical protein [Marinobacterium jannaschii]